MVSRSPPRTVCFTCFPGFRIAAIVYAAATSVPAKAARKKRRLIPVGADADHRGDEEALGGGQTEPESRCPKQRAQEVNAGGRAAEGGGLAARPGERRV